MVPDASIADDVVREVGSALLCDGPDLEFSHRHASMRTMELSPVEVSPENDTTMALMTAAIYGSHCRARRPRRAARSPRPRAVVDELTMGRLESEALELARSSLRMNEVCADGA